VVADLQKRLIEAIKEEENFKVKEEKVLREGVARKAALESILERLEVEKAQRKRNREGDVESSPRTAAAQERVRAMELLAIEREERYLHFVLDVHATFPSPFPATPDDTWLGVLEALVLKRCPQEYPELDRYISERGRELVLTARSAWLGAFRGALKACGWPASMGRQDSDDAGKAVTFSEEVVNGLERLIRLQAAAFSLQTASSVDFGVAAEGDKSGNALWVSEELALPLLERFAFHFEENSRSVDDDRGVKDIRDRPEWVFAFLLRALQLSKSALTDARAEECVGKFMPEVSACMPHPLLAFFARDLALAARRKMRAMLLGGSTEDRALARLGEEALAFDKALDEETGYHRCASPAGVGVVGMVQRQGWPRATDVLAASRQRLERWAEVEAAWVLGSLSRGCEAPGAWDAAPGLEEQAAPPTRAAQAFAGLVSTLTERYGPLRHREALRVLVERTLKALVRAYLDYLYAAAKACRLSRAAFRPDFEDVLRRYCLVVTAAHLGREAVEDAANEEIILRLEGAQEREGEGGRDVGARAVAKATGVASALASTLLAAGQEGMGSAVRTATVTTETLTKAVEDSGTIIGPTRLLTRALGSIQRAVGTPQGGRGGAKGEGARASSPSKQLVSEVGGGQTPLPTSALPRAPLASLSPPRGMGGGGRRGGSAPGTPTRGMGPREEPSVLEAVASVLGEDRGESGQAGGSGAAVLGTELLHLRSFEDGMLEDAITAVAAGFHDRAADYLDSLPSASLPTREPSPSLLPALAFLDSALQVAGRSVEQGGFLRLWQGVVFNVVRRLLRSLRSCRLVTQPGAEQMVIDMHALARVLDRPPSSLPGSSAAGLAVPSAGLRVGKYLAPLLETLGVLATPSRSLESLYVFFHELAGDREGQEGGWGKNEMAGEGSAAAAQIQYALEAKGLTTLSVEEVLAVIEQRRRGDAFTSQSRGGGAGRGGSTGPGRG
jgi:hypothetical protein